MTRLQTYCSVFAFFAAAVVMVPAQTLTTLATLYNFDFAHGANPFGGLVQGTDGNFYGTTTNGGDNNDGTVFKITAGGALTTLYSFHGTDGLGPDAALVLGSDGNFYGTTEDGGGSSNCMFGCGTIFKITPAGTLTTLYIFNGANGAAPMAALVKASDGNLYGTTASGGTDGQGTIFKVSSSGAVSPVYSFQGCAMDGSVPRGALVQATDGNLYGTTSDEYCGFGTVFKITLDGMLTRVHRFDPHADGAYPEAGLVQGSDSNFYGTTTSGGPGQNREGTVFKMTPSGAVTILHTFAGADGGSPFALIQARDGNLYGATNYDGPYRYGTLFKVSPTGVFTTLHAFGAGNGEDGTQPTGVNQATDGNFYGITEGGGTGSAGTIFRLVVLRPCIVCGTEQ
jgi:uncharacterized repeat protein (TIGR03803 family)